MKRDSNGAPIPGGSTCPVTGKKMWSSRREAKLAARRVNRGEHMSAYRCASCDWFHIGHMPEAVRTGALERDQLVPRRRPRPKGRA